MNDDDGRQSPDFTVADDKGKGRVLIKKERKYRRYDKVYLVVSGALEGPYHIERVSCDGRYTLCLADGSSAKNGDQFDESELQNA